MSELTWNPAWIRGSKIEEIIWIGKDVIAWSTGVHIIFFNVVEKKQSLQWCWNQHSGDGACCLSGHTNLRVFCFAEKTIKPRLLVYVFPAMSKIAECNGGSATGYLATAFAARDYLVSVGSYPNFPIIVWCWKTGEKLAAVDASIRDPVGQILRVTLVGPTVVAQMGKSCGKLFTWEFDAAGRVVILKDHEVTLPKGMSIMWMDWSPTSTEPLLAITDKEGHIFLSNYDGSDIYRIVLSQRCGICIEYELPMVRWFREGIVLRTTFCQIRFFKRREKTNRWYRVWYVKSMTKPCLLVSHPVHNDWFFYHTLEGYLMQIDCSDETHTGPMIKKYLEYGAVYRFADFIYPWCHHLIAVDNFNNFTILECYSGTVVTIYDPSFDGEIASQASHPDYPMIIVGTTSGDLVFISLTEPKLPRITTILRLQSKPLDLIKLSHSGRSLVAVDKNHGCCYCVSMKLDKNYEVEALVRYSRTIADALIYEGLARSKVLLLFVGATQYFVGQQLTVFDVPEGRNLITEAADNLELPGVYRTLWQTPSNAMILVGSPYLTRQLRLQRVYDFKDIAIVDALTTGHYVRLANLFVDRRWIASSAFDGLIFIRDKTVRRVIAHTVTHHRADFGSVKAMMNKDGDLIVSLGHNGSLAAFKFADKKEITDADNVEKTTEIYRVIFTTFEKRKGKIESDYYSLEQSVRRSLIHQTYVFPGPKEGNKTWTEWRDIMQRREEKEKCREERAAILTDLGVLQGKVKVLLDANELCPELERLPVSAFDLDTAGRDQKLKASRDECEEIHSKLVHNCSEMRRVTDWIRRVFWNRQEVLGKCLVSIYGDKEVANYPTVAMDPVEQNSLQWLSFCKEALNKILESETFQPWQIYGEEELRQELNKAVKLCREDDRRIDLLLEEEEEVETSEDDLKRELAMRGTTTHRYIEPLPYYKQMECYGFDHAKINNCFLMHDCIKLRAYFNEAFDQMYQLKQREMKVIQERIEKIRYINSELQIMFRQSVPYVPIDPEWQRQERPEEITEVLNHEIQSKPYVSPSQQEILDKEAAEAERIRLLLLADDFRERALMAMMDGVLEVRWEDTVKIDVPKPACMLEKQPEDYTEEDIQIVRQYEKDVEFLQEERKRYNRMLEVDYVRAMELMEDGIQRFNKKLDELFQLKINIESALNQIYLLYIRGRMRIYNRTKALRYDEEILEQISDTRRYEITLQTRLGSFHNVLQELFSQYDTLINRDKAAIKRFKSEFMQLNRLYVELLERQYKRRPRTNLRHLNVSDLLELGNCVHSKTRSTHLPWECMEYLNALDHLDVRPVMLPPTVETAHWDHLVKLRRSKMDTELKIRAKEAEIAKVETVILTFEHRIEKCRIDTAKAKTALKTCRDRQLDSELNVELQLVLKMRQVEINLTGNPNDAENAILVSKTEIDKANGFVRDAGVCKVDALTRLLNFQRGTLLKQWKHECQRKRLEDLQEDFRFVESVNVTKEMQALLKRKAMGLKDEKSTQQLIQEIDAIRKGFQDIVEGQRARLRSIQHEIRTIRNKNEQLDRQIFETNVVRCDMEQRRDIIGEARQQEHTERKIRMFMRRSDLIKKLQGNYAEMIELRTEYELLKLRRYPTLHFETSDDSFPKKEPARFDHGDFSSCR